MFGFGNVLFYIVYIFSALSMFNLLVHFAHSPKPNIFIYVYHLSTIRTLHNQRLVDTLLKQLDQNWPHPLWFIYNIVSFILICHVRRKEWWNKSVILVFQTDSSSAEKKHDKINAGTSSTFLPYKISDWRLYWKAFVDDSLQLFS